MPYSYDDHTCDALAYTMHARLNQPAYNVFCDYSAEEAREAFGGSVACTHPRRGQPMFTVKPANDMEEFHAVIDRLEMRQLLKNISYAEEEVRSLRNLPLPTAPSSSEVNTNPAPSLPHVDDVP